MTQNDISSTSVHYDPLLIKERFVGAMRQTLNNLSDNSAIHVRQKLVLILGEWNASVLASPDSLDQASNFVFTDEVLRDWIFATKFVFFMNIAAGGGHAVVRAILSDLALAASEDMEAVNFLSQEERAASDDAISMPKQLLEDLPTASQTRTVLASNTWLIVLLMLFSFVDLDHEILKNPEPNSNKTK